MDNFVNKLLEHPIAATILISTTLAGIAEVIKAAKAK